MSEPPSPFDPPAAALELESGAVRASARSSMDYLDAYRAFFKTPKWGTNLLLEGVCVLIPIVGLIGLQGYLAMVVARRHVHGEPIAPDFDFNRFGLFIGRGIWSFLASLIAAIVIVPVVGITIGILVVSSQSHDQRAPVAAMVVGGAFVFALSVFMIVVMRPIMLRANFFQSLTDVFSAAFIGDYVKRMWVEMIVTQLFMFATMIPLVIAGYAMCGFGIYPAMALMSFATAQLDLQLYEVYLSRGGTPVEINPKLLPLDG